MGVETAIGTELLAAELLGAGEGALTLGEFAAGAGAAVPELGVAAAPGAIEAAAAAETLMPPAVAETVMPPAIPEATVTTVAEGALPTEVLSAVETAAQTSPSWSQLSQTAQGGPFPASEFRTGLEALSQVSGLPYAGSLADTALATAAGLPAAEIPFDMGEFLGKYGKYGLPLATGVLGAAQAQGLQRQARALRRDLGTLPGATKAGQVGEQMVTAAQAGALPPGQEFQLQQAERAERARLEAYLSRAGISSGSSAESLRNQITQKYANMREASVGRYLNQGLQAMGISDQATAAAIRAGYAADQNAANLMQRYASAATQMIPGVYRPAVAASQVA